MTIALKDNNTRGDFVIDVTGEFATDLTLHTPIYISLFGGNTQADTPAQKRPSGTINLDWWGNVFDRTNPVFNTKFERALNEIPIMSGNLRLFVLAAEQDLQWLVDEGIAKSISASVRIAEAQKIVVEIDVIQPENQSEKFTYLWDQSLVYLREE